MLLNSMAMSVSGWPIRAVAVLLCTALAACSSAPTTTAPVTSSKASATRPTAAMDIGASVLAALRASQVDNEPTRALSFVQRALAQSPDRPELLWLAARLCGDVARCEPESYEARLRQLAPGNGVVWMGPLTRAQSARDSVTEKHVLEALSRESRFDVYWNALLSQAAVARSREQAQPPPKALNGPLTNAINEVADWLTAVAMPSFTGLAQTCSPDTARDETTAERCRRIAQVLQQGDTFAAEAVGIGLARRAVRPDSPSIVAIEERGAVLQYQHQAAREIMANQVEREKFSAELIELMKKLRREQDVSLAVLRWAGVSLTP
jgi:hypothetical protein